MASSCVLWFFSVTIWFIILSVHGGEAVEFAPIVKLNDGSVRGLVKDGGEYGKAYLYEGIPFGKAKRFSAPEPADPWSDVYNATRYRWACPQSGFNITTELGPTPGLQVHQANEDCLFLNVWASASSSSPVNRPVMVWIYGGGFIGGTIFNQIYDGRFVALTGDVVIVTANYRLGAFGWLYGGTDDAPGNQGLLDQQLALRWVARNIHHFGGNPAAVTLFGESAGSMSVGAQILSPLSAGLFHRAIMQSGAPNSYLGSEPRAAAYEKAKALGKHLSCSTESPAALVACLRTKTTEQIVAATSGAVFNGEIMIPVYGDAVLPVRPVEALRSGRFNRGVDLMFGVTRDEGAGFITQIFTQLGPDVDATELKVDTIKRIIELMFQVFREPFAAEVAQFYTRNLTDASSKDDLRRAVSNAFGDYHLICPTMFFGEQFHQSNFASESKPPSTTTTTGHIYSYRLTKPVALNTSECHGWQGVCHGEDVIYLFSVPIKLRGVAFTEAEYRLSADLARAWTNFARTGVPGTLGPTQWTPAFHSAADSTTVDLMQLDSEDYRMAPAFYKPTCDAFWKAKIFV